MLRRPNNKRHASDVRHVPHRQARNDSSAKEFQARIAELRTVPHDKLADAVFLLSMSAKQQSEKLRRSIKERAKVEIEFDAPPKGDLADFLAGEAVSIARLHEIGMPSLMDILSSRERNVDFTVEQRDAIGMFAAIIREQRLEGILEGLRLAGLLSKSPKNRHDDLGS